MLDQPHDLAFDRLTELACRLLDVPVALISFVDAKRQYFSGATGLPEPAATERQTPLSHSFCQHVVLLDRPLVVDDARDHELVRLNLAVRDLGVVAYCGVPLKTGDGQTLGSACAIDTKARRWTADDVRVLEQVAASVMTEIELRREVRDLARQKHVLAEERERMEAERRDRESAVRDREAFMAQIGHELRNSMNPATMAVQLLELDGRLPQGLRDEVATIRRSLGGGSRLVNDLLDTSRARSGQLHLERRAVDLAVVGREAVEDLRNQARVEGVELVLIDEAGCPPVHGDADRLRQVIANLVGNALKFTPDGGRVEVVTGCTNECSSITVTDTGTGIDAALLPTLFDPFVQAGPAAKQKEGLGLGLAICRGIAEAHGGTLRASSPGPGKGSTFRFEIPR